LDGGEAGRMMISLAEFDIALKGLLRLARFDASFTEYFDMSRAGARRSFRLALPLLPFILITTNLNTPWPADSDTGRIGAAEVICYALGWAIFPLILLSVGRWFERGPRVYGAIAVYNWLTVLQIGLQLPIELATFAGMGSDLDFVLSWAVLIFVLACEAFAFRRILAVGFELVAALVLIDFVLGRIITYLMFALALDRLL
jgi:hypothetical protein